MTDIPPVCWALAGMTQTAKITAIDAKPERRAERIVLFPYLTDRTLTVPDTSDRDAGTRRPAVSVAVRSPRRKTNLRRQ